MTARVALIYPHVRTRAASELLFAPLGVAALKSQLHRLGIESRIFDCTFEGIPEVARKVNEFRPEVIGIHSMITMSRHALQLADVLGRSLPESLMVAGGPLPTLYPDQYARAFDVVFRGEADLSFPSFCRDVLELKAPRGRLRDLPLERYAGLFIRQDGLAIDNAAVHHQKGELDTFPLPDRGDFDHAAYQRFWMEHDGSKTASIMTTFGCPFSCDFCSRPVFGHVFRRRELDAVFEEIGQLQGLGYDALWIADDTFTLSIDHLSGFCERIAGRNLGWSCLSRVTGIDEHITALMKSAGCRRVYLGLETGSQDTLDLMKKQATVEDGIHAVHRFHEAGIQVAAFFIVGYPGESVASIEQTCRLALTLPLDSISFNVPFPLPGSPLFERVGRLDPTRDWKEENEVTFVYESGFDAAWLERRIGETMQAFADKHASP